VHIDLSYFYRVVLRPLLWLVLAVYFLFVIGLVMLRYAVLPAIDEYRPGIERLVGRTLGAPVSIAKVEAEWLGLNPSFELSAVRIADGAGEPVLELPRVYAILSWRSLLVLQPRLLRLEIDRPRLDARRDEQGRYWVAGRIVDLDADDGSHDWLAWLLAQREVSVRDAVLRWDDALRGAPTLEISQIALTLQNVGRRHRAALRATPPPHMGSTLDVRADFVHGWFTLDPADPDRWRGSVYAVMDRMELVQWLPWIDAPGSLQDGTGTLRAWLDYERGRIRSATARVAVAGLRTRLAPDLPPLALARAEGTVELKATQEGYEFDATQLDVRAEDGRALHPERFAGRWAPARGETPAAVQLDVAGVDLASAAFLADRVPLAEGARAWLAELTPDGRIDALRLTWAGSPAAASLESASARFSGLSLAPAPEPAVNDGHHPQRPGFSNLQGVLEIDRQGGRIEIDAKHAVLRFPGVFAEPDLPMEDLRVRAAARRISGDAWTVDVERLEFANGGVRGSFSGNWSSQGRSPAGTLDLRGRLERADVREVHRYIPIVVGDSIRTWLRHALVAGEAQDVDVRLRGDLDGFPYGGDTTGEFRVAGRFAGVTLDYLPAPLADGDLWPRLEELAGDLVFDRVSMTVDARSGRVRVNRSSTVALGRTRAGIADLTGNAVLEIAGETRGPAPAFLTFVKSSPVGRMIGGVLDEASASGSFVVPIALRIPLAQDAPQGEHEVQVKGEVRLAGNGFSLAPSVPPFSGLTGTVAFDDRGIAFRDVRGLALGGPIRLSGGPQPDGSDLLQAEGTAEATALSFWWKAPGMARLAGRTAYKVSVRIEPDKAPVVLVESDLVGMSIDLPAPLGKTAQEARPSRLEWNGSAAAGATRSDWFAGSLGPAVNLHIERDHDAQGAIREVRGAVGIHRAATIHGPGLSVSAQLPEVDVDGLRKLVEEFKPDLATGEAAGKRALDVPLNRISLATPLLRAHGRQLRQVNLFATRQQGAGGTSWRVDVESAQLAGRLSWAETGGGAGPSRLTARLSRLMVDTEAEEEGSATAVEADPGDADVPEIDLVAEHFELFGKRLGRLEVLAQRADRGREWRLRKLSVTNPDAELDGTGVWKVAAEGASQGKRAMSLDAVLKLHDAGAFLDRMGVRGAMAGGTGTLSAQVSWNGLPYALDLPSLSGTLELSLDKGQFLKAEPGIAKLLGVLSLQSLPRRVTLDFRDVFSEGFAYDTIRAHARIVNGVAHTDDFKMNGVNATVVIAGDTDLAREIQKLHVVVVPKLDAGAASLLYGLAVNPAVGLSVFLAQLLLKNPLSEVLAYQYEITGTWTDPQVTKVQPPRAQGSDSSPGTHLPGVEHPTP